MQKKSIKKIFLYLIFFNTVLIINKAANIGEIVHRKKFRFFDSSVENIPQKPKWELKCTQRQEFRIDNIKNPQDLCLSTTGYPNPIGDQALPKSYKSDETQRKLNKVPDLKLDDLK